MIMTNRSTDLLRIFSNVAIFMIGDLLLSVKAHKDTLFLSIHQIWRQKSIKKPLATIPGGLNGAYFFT